MVDVSQIADAQIRFLLRKRKEISLWTYNSPEQIKKYIDMGVDFITTDNLSACMDVKSDH